MIANALKNISGKKDVACNETTSSNVSTLMDEKLTNYDRFTIEEKHTIGQATLGSNELFQANVKNRLRIGEKTCSKAINDLDEEISPSRALMVKTNELSFMQKLQRQSI